ncbi:3'(2'),5'-bisphosphate nucleotidase CysQ [Persephonella sp.]
MDKFLKNLINIAKEAGDEILKVYNSAFSIEYKEDKSPLTEADKKAHSIILNGLKKISDYPVLSEEGRGIPYEERKNWKRFWMVDPLDGTKEFIKKTGEFTVNIALIEENKSVLGVVYAPAIDVLYFGGRDVGAFKLEKGSKKSLNGKKKIDKEEIVVVASRSHLNKETEQFIKKIEESFKEVKIRSIGSSLKICLLAEREADVYPRLAPTMEWDTAAAHAVLSATGGKIVQYKEVDSFDEINSLPEVEYNKENLLNPYFIAVGPDVI